jgi:hypothetical protein
MLVSPSQTIGLLLLKFGSRSLTLRAELRRSIALMNITANCANKLFHYKIPPVDEIANIFLACL